MELNVGDYVRTKEFGINRVKWFDNGEPILENGFTALQSSGYKSRPKIIDLIEENDLVQYRINGDLYVSQVEGHPIFDKYELYVSFMCLGKLEMIDIEDLNIVSILTHEQFEAMQYVVGDKNAEN